jgi:hypothetical protein
MSACQLSTVKFYGGTRHILLGTSAMRYAMKNAVEALEKSLPVRFKSALKPITAAYWMIVRSLIARTGSGDEKHTLMLTLSRNCIV